MVIKKTRAHRQIYKESRTTQDALNYWTLYSGDSQVYDVVVASLPQDDYTDDLDKKLTAIDNLKQRMSDWTFKIIIENGTALQIEIMSHLMTGKYTYLEIAEMMDKEYFSIYSAIHGQMQNGRHVGGLMKKLNKVKSQDPLYNTFLMDIQKLYDNDSETINKYLVD